VVDPLPPFTQEISMHGITGFGHAALKVHDLAASLAFYEGILGFPEMMRLHKPDGSTWLVYLRITDTVYLEIFPDAETARAPGWEANGVHHLCLMVEDIVGVTERLTAAGIALVLPVKTGADGNRQAWIEDPDGNRIELMEMAADSLQLKAIARLKSERR
jgi:lactoylglutathione lyase